jgi:hypothetical protein
MWLQGLFQGCLQEQVLLAGWRLAVMAPMVVAEVAAAAAAAVAPAAIVVGVGLHHALDA